MKGDSRPDSSGPHQPGEALGGHRETSGPRNLSRKAATAKRGATMLVPPRPHARSVGYAASPGPGDVALRRPNLCLRLKRLTVAVALQLWLFPRLRRAKRERPLPECSGALACPLSCPPMPQVMGVWRYVARFCDFGPATVQTSAAHAMHHLWGYPGNYQLAAK